MLRAYLDAALRQATHEQREGDEGFYGEIPGFDGLWANGPSLDACRQELAAALDDWVVAGLQLGSKLPTVRRVQL